MSKLFDENNIQTFDKNNILQDMLNAKEGTVFVLGDRQIKNPEGDDTVEVTFVQIQKARDGRGFTYATPTIESENV